jgi:hypothetical protein
VSRRLADLFQRDRYLQVAALHTYGFQGEARVLRNPLLDLPHPWAVEPGNQGEIALSQEVASQVPILVSLLNFGTELMAQSTVSFEALIRDRFWGLPVPRELPQSFEERGKLSPGYIR